MAGFGIGDGAHKKVFEVFADGFEGDDGATVGAEFIEDGLDAVWLGAEESEFGGGAVVVLGSGGKGIELAEPLRRRGRACNFYFVTAAVFGKVVDGSLHSDPALDENGDAVADHFEFAEEVTVEEDGFFLIFEGEENIADFATTDGIDAVGGFIKDDEVGVVDEGLGEANALHHALGIGGNFFVGPLGHADGGDELGGPLLPGAFFDFGEGGVEFEGLAAGEISGDAVVLGEVADAGEGGFVADGTAEEGSFEFGGADDGHHDFDKGAFSRAVGTEEAEDFTGVDLHGDATEGVDFAFVGFFDIVEVEGGGAKVLRGTGNVDHEGITVSGEGEGDKGEVRRISGENQELAG